MTCNTHIHKIYALTFKAKCLMFILSKSTLLGIIYIGRTPTMEHNQLYPNIFHQPSYNLQMYEKYILTTTRFSLVYYSNPNCNVFLFHTPGKLDDLTININFQLNYLNRIHTKEVDQLKFKRNNNLPPWYPVFQIPYQIKLNVYYSAHTLWSS